MSSKLQKSKQALSEVTDEECAFLAEHLVANLNDDNDVNADALWIVEAEARYQRYREGRLTARPAVSVFDEAYKKFAC